MSLMNCSFWWRLARSSSSRFWNSSYSLSFLSSTSLACSDNLAAWLSSSFLSPSSTTSFLAASRYSAPSSFVASFCFSWSSPFGTCCFSVWSSFLSEALLSSYYFNFSTITWIFDSSWLFSSVNLVKKDLYSDKMCINGDEIPLNSATRSLNCSSWSFVIFLLAAGPWTEL